jgi:hypothetical protein
MPEYWRRCRMSKNAKELVGRYKAVRLTDENHIGIWPFCYMGSNLYKLGHGWELVGWCKSPTYSVRKYMDALVLENSNEDYEGRYGAGIWWIHCDLKEMNFTEAQDAGIESEVEGG